MRAQVLVSQQVYDLLEMHAVNLEKSVDDLEGELRLTGAYDNDLPSLYSSPSFAALETGRSQTPHVLEAWDPTSDGLGVDPGSLAASSLPSLLFTRSMSLLGPSAPSGLLRTMGSLKRAREAVALPESKAHVQSSGQKEGAQARSRLGPARAAGNKEKALADVDEHPPAAAGNPPGHPKRIKVRRVIKTNHPVQSVTSDPLRSLSG